MTEHPLRWWEVVLVFLFCILCSIEPADDPPRDAQAEVSP